MVDQVFSEISKESVRAVKGTVLMRQGEIGRSAYFVVQGRLLVEREINGENFAVAEIGPRDIVGEMAILDDAPRSATVTVIEDAMLVLLDKNRIRQIIRRSPVVAELILKLLCYKLRTAHQAIQNITSLDNPEVWIKICKTLLLCDNATEDSAECYRIFYEQLEDVIGIAEDLRRDVLARLGKAKLIISEGREIQQINDSMTKLFIWLGQEDFSNREFDPPSEIKIYQSAEALLNYFGQIAESQESANLQYDALVNALATSHLWSQLRPALQHQRAKSVVEFFIEKEIVTRNQQNNQTLSVVFPRLKAIEHPKDLMQTYNMIKNALLPSD